MHNHIQYRFTVSALDAFSKCQQYDQIGGTLVCCLTEDPADLAEDILRSLPDGRFLIQVWTQPRENKRLWRFLTQHKDNWRTLVPEVAITKAGAS